MLDDRGHRDALQLLAERLPAPGPEPAPRRHGKNAGRPGDCHQAPTRTHHDLPVWPPPEGYQQGAHAVERRALTCRANSSRPPATAYPEPR